ncbi:hypothetical protein HDE_02952 [Halotydeus destructor]|nr:hypothetical protein HDE_02952 [Halotydeus destructor]
MAAIHPFNPVPSTPSSSSQSSLPPSYALPVHDHVLPPGWSCKFDPKSGKYFFYQEHISQQFESLKPHGHGSGHSSRSSSPSHARYAHFQNIAKFKSSDPTVHKISKMFPEVEEHHIVQLLRIYHNKENSVISALLAEVHAKAAERANYTDDALFYKLRGYFPTTDSETIRFLINKYNYVEHEVIAALVAGLGPQGDRRQVPVHGSPKMKLRYLKLVYPEADEAILFDLLYNCDHNAQTAIERLDKMGYTKLDILGRPSSAKVETLSSIGPDAARAIRAQSAPHGPRTLIFPPSVTDKQRIYDKLHDEFPKADRTLINMALECGGFNQDRARLFLAAMTPQDHEKYLSKSFAKYASPLMARPCRGTQTGTLIETISGTPIIGRRSFGQEMCSASTWTKEDGIIIEGKKQPLAKGADPSHRKGPRILNIIKSYLPWRGSDSKNKHGPDPNNRVGPDYSLRNGSSAAKGPDSKNRKGPNRMLRLLKKSSS